MKPWFARFRRYPGSVLGHIAWGAVAGLVASRDPVSGAVLLSGGYAYQFGSAWRKSEQGRIDTVGLDAFDYPVGFAIGYAVGNALKVVVG